MSCADCEDCSRHIYNGGKCKRWEYNCPFDALKELTNEKIKIVEDIITKFSDVKLDIEDLNINNFEFACTLIDSLITELEDSIDKQLIEEWKSIQ